MSKPTNTTPALDTTDAAPKRSTKRTARKAKPRKAPAPSPALAPHDQTAITRRRDMALATAATWIAQGEDVSRVLSDLYTMAANNTHHDLGLPSVFRAA